MYSAIKSFKERGNGSQHAARNSLSLFFKAYLIDLIMQLVCNLVVNCSDPNYGVKKLDNGASCRI